MIKYRNRPHVCKNLDQATPVNLTPVLIISAAILLKPPQSILSSIPHAVRVNLPAEMMVSLPSSSPLNQSAGTDCSELDQPRWPLLLLPFQRSVSHHYTVSEAAVHSLKWNLISPSPFSCLCLCLRLPAAWCINPGVIFCSSDLSYRSSP